MILEVCLDRVRQGQWRGGKGVVTLESKAGKDRTAAYLLAFKLICDNIFGETE